MRQTVRGEKESTIACGLAGSGAAAPALKSAVPTPATRPGPETPRLFAADADKGPRVVRRIFRHRGTDAEDLNLSIGPDTDDAGI